jgi:hypothetical protein
MQKFFGTTTPISFGGKGEAMTARLHCDDADMEHSRTQENTPAVVVNMATMQQSMQQSRQQSRHKTRHTTRHRGRKCGGHRESGSCQRKTMAVAQ